MALDFLTAEAAIILGIILGTIGFAHTRGALNFFKKKKTGVTVGLGAIGLAAFFIVGSMVNLGGLPLLGAIAPSSTLSAGGGADAPAQGVSGTGGAVGVQKVIGTLNVQYERAADGDQNQAAGHFEVFSAASDPSSATASPLFDSAVASGTGAFSPASLLCNKDYRVVFEGNASTTFYDKDHGVTQFECPVTDESAPTVLFNGGAVDQVGTIDDILDETSPNGEVNGQTTDMNTSSLEIQNDGTPEAADDTLFYDESVGDEVWYLDITPAASTANAVVKDYVLVFDHDNTNPPEGNEYTSITAQLQTGTDFGIPDELVDFWKNEIPIELGTLKAGQSATYRITFNVVEANEDGNDDWTLRADDLGDFQAQDLRNGRKATGDTVTYGGSQA